MPTGISVRKSLLLPAMLMAFAFVLSACGSSDGQSSDGTEAQGGYNKTDAAFAANMLPHHEGGVKLGQLAVDKGIDPQVKSIDQDIVDAQTAEIETLKRILQDSGGGSPVMPGPIEQRDMADMAKLQAASGQEFDRLSLEVISGHHSAAIQMAEIEKVGGKSSDAKELATSIVETQSSELTKFNTLLEQMG